MTDELRTGDQTSRPDNEMRSRDTCGPIDRERVAGRAYQRYQMRRGRDGNDLQDWFEAERELIAAQHEQE